VNILVITYWSYKEALVQSCTLPYLEMIKKINPSARFTLVTFEHQDLALKLDEKQKEVSKLEEKGIQWRTFPYFRFGTRSIFSVIRVVIRLFFVILTKKVTHIHAFGISAGTIAYILSKLTATRLVIDSYEPHAESMVENGEWNKDSKAYKIQSYFEKLLAHSAQHFIATSYKVKEYAKTRFGADLKSFFVKPAGVDVHKFNPHLFNKKEVRSKFQIPEDAIVAVYIGKFGGIYYKEETFQLLKAASDTWKEKFYAIIGSPIDRKEFEELVNQYQIPAQQVLFLSYVPHNQVPEILAMADFAINPVKPVPTKRYCTSVKDGEYWAMELPVIIPPNISDDSDYIQEKGIGVIWSDTSYEGCLKACQEMKVLLESENLPQIKSEIRKLAIEVRAFENFEKIYRAIYSSNLS
jgi:glycosyltransferase involved in cell wall biosynthesis